MDIHYNAFISYRHHPQDMKVAEAIHRGLERFRIPKALKKKKDTRIRLFRDKEELPITSNLSDDITRALRNSDYLIVICSTHTKESMWVQREIETFLQTHDHSRVLTVLADGEPYDTIPPVLCSRQQVDPVTGEKIMVPIEPLSCDWRMGRRKAHREELPRLAAVLLGCGYDELRQRQRQYRIRRTVTALSIAASLVLAFTGYVVYNSIQLQKANNQLTDANEKILTNLNAALINQSQYLAGASAQSLEEGDRMLAMALALKALPEYEGQRPYLPQAEYALANALCAYTAESKVAGVGTLSCDALVQTFAATDARDRMFVVDQLNMLSVWDLEIYSKLASVEIPGVIGDLIITPENYVIFLGSNRFLYCYDADLNLCWFRQDCFEIAVTGDRSVILAEMAENTVVFLDAATGFEAYPAARILLPEEDQNNHYISFCQDAYELDKPILLQYDKTGEPLRVVAWDLQEKRLWQVATVPSEYSVRCATYTASGDVAILTNDQTGQMNGRYGRMTVCSPMGLRILCFSQAGEALWDTKLSCYSYSSTHMFGTIRNRSQLFCQINSLLAVIDETDGKVISACEIGAVPIWTQMNEDTADILMEDGSKGVYYYDDNQFFSTRYFKENIRMGFAGKGAFLNQVSSRDILVYKSTVDENWTVFEGDYAPGSIHKVMGDGVMALDYYSGISLFDTVGKKHLWTVEGASADRFQPLDFTDSSRTFWFSNNSKEIRKLDMQTGQVQSFLLPEALADGRKLFYPYSGRVCMSETIICTLAKESLAEQFCLAVLDTDTLETSLLELTVQEEDAGGQFELLTLWGDKAYLWNEDQCSLLTANLQTGRVDIAREHLSGRPTIQVLPDGKFCMLTEENQVSLVTRDGSTIFEVQLKETKAVSCFRTEEKVYLLTEAGKLLIFDPAGHQLGETALQLYDSFFNNMSVDFDPGDISWSVTRQGDLFVNVFNSGNLIHRETSQLRAWIPNCVGYLPDSDAFLTTGKDTQTGTDKMGMYACYRTEDVIRLAREALGSYTLTPEQAERYGIS